MSVTLKDIADEVGVSISTVSRAISGDTEKRVKPSTKAQIDAAIEKLGYITNLPKADEIPDHGSIAIILASSEKSFSHPFFAEMLSSLQEEIYKTNFSIEYVLSESALSKEKFYETIISHPVSGAVILGRLNEQLLGFLKENIPHLVYTGVNYVGHDTDEVICNGYDAIATLYQHFTSIGFDNIAYIGPIGSTKDPQNDFQRYASYLKCLESHNIAQKQRQILHAGDTLTEGYSSMLALIKEDALPEAIICASDSIALGVIRAAHEHHILIPNDVAIASIDNILMAEYCVPNLTTIDVSKQELSRLTVNMLVDKIENCREKNVRLDVPFELIIRESCGYNIKAGV